MASVSFLISSVILMSTTYDVIGVEITIYIQYEDGLHFLDIPSNITAVGLYESVSGMSPSDVLSFGGIEIGRTDPRHISDLSICPESVIQITRRTLTDEEALYEFASDLRNKENIPWWNNALRCHQFPDSALCLPGMACNWPNIQCNHEEDTVIGVSFGCDMFDRWTIGGEAALWKLPKSIVYFEAEDVSLEAVDFKGLEGHSIMVINLSGNEIKIADISHLQRSSVKILNLSWNKIEEIDLTALPSSLIRLELSSNKISAIDLTSLPPTLTHLDLAYNKIESLTPSDLQALHDLRTCNVDLQGNPGAPLFRRAGHVDPMSAMV